MSGKAVGGIFNDLAGTIRYFQGSSGHTGSFRPVFLIFTTEGKHPCERGLLTLEEASEMLGFCKAIVRRKRAKGVLPMAAHKLNDMGEYMYEPLPPENTEKSSHCSSSDRRGAV